MRFLSFLLLIATFHAVPARAADDCTPRDEPVIWQVSDEDTTITLVGTVHRLRPGEFRLPASLRAGRYDTAVFESRSMSAWGMLRIALQARSPRDLEESLTSEQWSTLRQLADRVGVPQVTLQRLDPFLLAGTLEEKTIGLTGRRNSDGADALLKRDLGRRSTETLYLEEQRDIFALIRGFTYAAKIDFLLDTMARLNGPEAWTFVDAWVAGDTCALERQAEEVSQYADANASYREIHEGLVLRRNQIFAQRIIEMLDVDGRHIVAVGALHFYGQGSIRERLEAAGHRVVEISADAND